MSLLRFNSCNPRDWNNYSLIKAIVTPEPVMVLMGSTQPSLPKAQISPCWLTPGFF